MIPCRIEFNRLPEEILQAVLRVDEVRDGDPRWRLLRSGNSRRTYRFAPEPGAPAWLVKWGCRYSSWKQIRNALRGRDDATVEWQKTQRAASSGIPVLDFSLLAAPRFRSGRIQTLLVTPFLDESSNFIQFLLENHDDRVRIAQTLERLGTLVADIHSRGILHQDLSLDNILVCDRQGEKILAIDWFKMRDPRPGESDPYRIEMIAPISDMVFAGLTRERIFPFLESYAREMVWCRDRFDELLQTAIDNRKRVCQRAYRNCIRRSRRMIQYRRDAYRVFLFKNGDETAVERATHEESESGNVLTSRRARWNHGEGDSKPLLAWRLANVLKMTGVGGHRCMAYAAQKGLFSVRDLLVMDERGSRTPLQHWLDPPTQNPNVPVRKSVLRQAGFFLRRLHELSIGFRSIALDDWWTVPAAGGRLEFGTEKLNSMIPFGCDDFERRFGWLADPEIRALGFESLLVFLRGYGDGQLDRDLLKQILTCYGDTTS